MYDILDRVNTPDDMKPLSVEELKKLCEEVRAETIRAVSNTGGHLGAGLGVVELTVALHHVFDTPNDRLIWDVGHQAYPHKILTGRKDRIETLRQEGGLYGFTKRSESQYDPFGAGHSSTSISAGLGMAVARDQLANITTEHKSDSSIKPQNHVISVIGDGALSAGMAYEAMNNAGALDSRLIVILNDNDMSISPSTGAMSSYLSRLLSSKSYQKFRTVGKHLARKFPKPFENALKKAEEYARGFVTGGTLFEEMGFFYVGPVDGHNLDHLLPILRNLKTTDYDGPVLLHVVTEKGKGFAMAEESVDKGHAVGKFDLAEIEVGEKVPNPARAAEKPLAPSYSKVFAQSLIAEAHNDPKVIAITAAMAAGTGLEAFQQEFPNRFFDVGIAEQHAVTFAAGLASEGLRPFAAIYSTFLQRAYDQVVHDVALQNLPVRFAIDRAGFVGADGATHAGSFDITYLATLPNFVVMAAADELELMHMTATATAYDEGPIAFRYPRGNGLGLELPKAGIPLQIGKGRVIQEGSQVAMLSLGTRLQEALKAADQLAEQEIECTVADARFAKPLDYELITELAKNHEVLVTIEEGSIGGFGSHVMKYLTDEGLLDSGLKVRTLCIPDVFLPHGSQDFQAQEAGLVADDIIAVVQKTLGLDGAADSDANKIVKFPLTA